MIAPLLDSFLKPHAQRWLTPEAMKHHGTKNLMAWAKTYNMWRYGKRSRLHKKAYLQERNALLEGNGGSSNILGIRLDDGWCIHTDHALPYIDQLLEEMGEVVRERGGRRHSDIQQPFLRSLIFPGDLEKYPSMLNFITSNDILAPVMDYLGTVPVLSKTRPPGVRFMESNKQLDPSSGRSWRESQLYHLDLHDSPLVYVLVAVEDITPQSGPWTFLPASVSRRSAEALKYQMKGSSYRVTDEEMYRVIDPKEAIQFTGPKGSVLFIDSSRCFHFGSRDSWPPRFQLMYAYTSAVRGDFSQTFMSPHQYPMEHGISRLRRMVLE